MSVLEVPVKATSRNAESSGKPLYFQSGPTFLRQYCQCIFQPVFAADIHQIRQLPNLRRFHISPWTNLEAAADELGRDFVLEVVAHPDTLHVQTAEDMREWLERTMEVAGDCVLDLNLGEIETVFGDPSVLITWAEIAQDVAESHA